MTDLKSIENYLYEYALPGMLLAALKADPDGLRAITDNAKNSHGGKGKDKVIGLFNNTEWLSPALIGEVGQVAEHCGKVLTMIIGLEDPEMQAAFRCRYFRRMTFSEIAEKLYMSSTKVKTLHKSGLIILKERYN